MAFEFPVCTEEENTKRVLQEARQFAKKNKAKALLVFDFDELLTFNHASRVLTHLTASKEIRDAILNTFRDYSFKALLALSNLKIGMSKRDYLEAIEEAKEELRFRPEALEVLKFFSKRKDCKVLVLSAGSFFIQSELFRRAKLNVPVFACRLAFHKNNVIGSEVIFLDESKSLFVRTLKRSKNFKKVFVLGHSKGDAGMMREGIGISVNGDEFANAAAKYKVKDLLEARDLIETFL
ncbi:MAG: hypothetical protein V1847_03260 [Candidatus Diapherotrites archaeon]